ncbi:MAG: hypothetical protein M3441_17625 [Chloroflexota bacterium]|nr:hypothetical protein [Chloroflexota bacterium]
MSNGPTPGNQLPPLIIPKGSRVFYSTMVETWRKAFVQLKDSTGKVIFTLEGMSPKDPFKAVSIGDGSFQAEDPSENYTLSIGTEGSAKGATVLWNHDALVMGNTIYLQCYTYISEDAGDKDFNDCYVSLYWFHSVG